MPGHEFVGVVEDAPPADTDVDRPARHRGRSRSDAARARAAASNGARPLRSPVRARHHRTRRRVRGVSVAASRQPSQRCLTRVDDEAAVLVEPLAAACRVLEQADRRHARDDMRPSSAPAGSGCSWRSRCARTDADVTIVGRGETRPRARAESLGFEHHHRRCNGDACRGA